MASVYKPKGSKKYVISFLDEQGHRRKKTGATDKGVTQRIARDLENKIALRREGLIDPKADAYRAHEGRAIAGHLDDFRAALAAKGGSAKHPAVTRNRAARVLELAGVKRIPDLTPSVAMGAIAALRVEGLSAETVNHHVRAVKAFARWLWRDGRTRDHALAHLSTSSAAGDRRRPRRALTPAEAARLVTAAESGPIVQGMAGPDRARCYLVALGTGFRAAELASLTPERFDLAGRTPTATVPAGYTKNGREAVQPLAPALARRLGPWLAELPPGVPVFRLSKRAAEMMRVDLAAAGIDYETAAGVADFHSLRAAYISNLVASGASVKTCQVLARHSTPSLTIGVYAKATVHDLAGAVGALPDIAPGTDDDARAIATGTDGRRGLPATGCATDRQGDEPQVIAMNDVSATLRVDLKSSGGEPPCGFDPHRR